MRYSKCSIRRIYLRRALYTAAVIRADCAIPSCVGMIMQEFPTQLSDWCICWNIYFKQYQGGNCVCFGHISHMITPCSSVPRCRVIILGQYWFRLWLVVWRHQAIAWTNVDLLSVKSCAIHHMSISQKMNITTSSKHKWVKFLQNHKNEYRNYHGWNPNLVWDIRFYFNAIFVINSPHPIFIYTRRVCLAHKIP